jgi:hypothetical protein
MHIILHTSRLICNYTHTEANIVAQRQSNTPDTYTFTEIQTDIHLHTYIESGHRDKHIRWLRYSYTNSDRYSYTHTDTYNYRHGDTDTDTYSITRIQTQI